MTRAVLAMSWGRAVGLAVVVLVVACGGTQVPTHGGYKGKKPRPWEKPKVLKLEKNAAKFDVELDYARFKRARWLAADLPVIPLWHEDNVAITNADVVGYQVLPNARLSGLARVRKEKGTR